MAKQTKKSQEQVLARALLAVAAVAVVAFFAMGVVGWWGYCFTTGMVKNELKAQKIYFPPKGPALDPAEYPDLQKYAGQQVDNGIKAKAYANGFIGRHLQKVAGGKVYAEVSAEAMKDPTNIKLQQQKATLFQGETLRGLLLGNGYAYWMMGQIARVAALISFLACAVTLAYAAALYSRLKMSR